MAEQPGVDIQRLDLDDLLSNGLSVQLADSLGGLQANPDNRYGDDQYDAFRYAYASARFTEAFGSGMAKFLGDRQEGRHNTPSDPKELAHDQAQKNMDFYNNNVGRQEYQQWKDAHDSGATTDSLERWIYNRVREGATTNNINDPRRWHEPPWMNLNTPDTFNTFARFPQRADPFTLDLDGDGLETVGVK